MFLYRVQYGDSPSSIAEHFTGNPERARDLIIANPQKEWTGISGVLTFKSLDTGEILTLPTSWHVTTNIGIGVGRPPLVGLGAGETMEDMLKSAAEGGDFPLEKLSRAARAEVDKLSSQSETLKRAQSVATVIESISQGGITWQDAVNVSATVATFAAGPIAGAVVMGLGMGLEALRGVLGDMLPFLGGSSRIPSYAVDISMDCLVVKNTLTGKREPGKNAPYGFDSPGWWHIVDRNVVKPGTETWDPRGIPGVAGPWVFTGTAWIYMESDFATKCRYTNTTMECSLPNYENFQYRLPGRALMWMFGVVFNELWEIDQSLADSSISSESRNELGFRKFFYSLLLRNWESRINCNVNMNDRLLLIGAVKIWNDAHINSSSIKFKPIFPNPPANYFADAAKGYCNYEFNISGRVPNRPTYDSCECPSNGDRCDWSVTDISWSRSKTFIEFMLTGTFDPLQQREMAPIDVNLGSEGIITERFTSRKKISKTSTSTTKKVVIGTAVIGAISAASLWYYSYRTGHTFGGAAKYLYGKTKRKLGLSAREAMENPIDFPPKRELPMLPSGPTSTAIVPYKAPFTSIVPRQARKRVAYRFELGGDPYMETVRMMSDGTAVAYRNTRPIARFIPTKYQYSKIRAGNGTLLVYMNQLLEK